MVNSSHSLVIRLSCVRWMFLIFFFPSTEKKNKQTDCGYLLFLLDWIDVHSSLISWLFDNPSTLTNHKSELSSLIPLNSTKRSKSNWKLLFLFLSPARDTKIFFLHSTCFVSQLFLLALRRFSLFSFDWLGILGERLTFSTWFLSRDFSTIRVLSVQTVLRY